MAAQGAHVSGVRAAPTDELVTYSSAGTERFRHTDIGFGTHARSELHYILWC